MATFTVDWHHTTAADSAMKLPRYLLVNVDSGRAFMQLLEGNAVKRNVVY